MRATIKVEMDNAAFNPDPTFELANIMQALSDRLRYASPDESFPLRDSNGNKVGECIISGRR